jgi:predicted P-loop ATPase/GTPase
MIRIRVNAGQDAQTRVSELYDAVREETRVWSMSDMRRTKNLKLVHSARNVKGTIRRVKSNDSEYLEFECKAKDEIQEAITAGRFVHLVLRYMPSISEVAIHRI